MNVIGFKIWYADGSVRQAADWLELPKNEVLIVVTYEAECFVSGCHYRVMIDGQDWYWWDGERVQGVPSKASGWQAPSDVDEALLKRGTMVGDADFKRISALAQADLRWLEPSS